MFDDILQSLKDPSSRHAMMVHFPIVLGTLSFLPIFAALVFRLRHKALLWVALVMLVMMSVSVFVAIQAGEAAEENLRVFDITNAEEGAIQKHEELAVIDCEVEVLENRELAVALDDVFEDDPWHAAYPLIAPAVMPWTKNLPRTK